MTTNAVREKFDQFRTTMGELVALKGIEELLGWDQQVMMPEKSGDARGLQMQAISGVLHDKATSKELGNLLTELESFGPEKLKQELSEWERAAIRDARRNYDKEVKLPKELVQKAAKLNVEGFNAWVAAKKNNDFQKFAPILKEWVSLKKETAKALNPTLPAYDVLLDNFERGLSTKTIDNLFTQIKEALIPLIEKIKSKPEPDSSFLEKNFDVEAQAKFNHQLAKDLGFDTNSGRLDVSAHPFTCGIHSTDVRMTTRYKENDIMEGITGTIHETGHSLYEQGRTKDPLPVSEALSMGIHESQSLLWERMVGLSLPFWEYLTPKLKESFPQIPKEVTAEQVYRAFNKSKPGLIRIESDEVTYPMHIILRYEIERDLIEGGLDVNDLPKVWNEKMKKYLGIEPPTDSVGVLQDVHWSGGAFGYFPTYTLGAIYASQFFAQAEREISGLNDHLRKGNFAILKEWLNKKVHEKGSLIPSGELLMKEVTGEPLNPQVFINYLKQKYTKLYNL